MRRIVEPASLWKEAMSGYVSNMYRTADLRAELLQKRIWILQETSQQELRFLRKILSVLRNRVRVKMQVEHSSVLSPLLAILKKAEVPFPSDPVILRSRDVKTRAGDANVQVI